MNQLSASTNLFNIIPHDILRIILGLLTIPGRHSFRCSFRQDLPRDAFPRIFVRWTFLPRVEIGGITDHVVCAHGGIDECLALDLCPRNALTDWCLACKPISRDLSSGVREYNKDHNMDYPEFEPISEDYCVHPTIATCVEIAYRLGRQGLSALQESTDPNVAAMLLFLGVNPGPDHTPCEETLQYLSWDLCKKPTNDHTFIVDDMLIAKYAVAIPDRSDLAAEYLGMMWHGRLPTNPDVYEVLRGIPECVIHSPSDLRSCSVAIDTCYVCRHGCLNLCLRAGQDVFVAYLRHQAQVHPNTQKLLKVPEFSLDYLELVKRNMVILCRTCAPAPLSRSIADLIAADPEVWACFQQALFSVYGRDAFDKIMFALKSSRDQTPMFKHLLAPDQTTLYDIYTVIKTGDVRALQVMLCYGKHVVKLIRDSSDDPAINQALANCTHPRIVEIVSYIRD